MLIKLGAAKRRSPRCIISENTPQRGEIVKQPTIISLKHSLSKHKTVYVSVWQHNIKFQNNEYKGKQLKELLWLIKLITPVYTCETFRHKTFKIRRTQPSFSIQIQLHLAVVFDHHRVIITIFQIMLNCNTNVFRHTVSLCGIPQIFSNCYNIRFYAIGEPACKIERLANVCNGKVKVLSYTIKLLALKSLYIYIYIYIYSQPSH